jgi:hypothetical protein
MRLTSQSWVTPVASALVRLILGISLTLGVTNTPVAVQASTPPEIM